jgi:homoserine kinase
VLVIPDLEVATRDAREALPASVPHAQAAANVQRTAVLLAALATGERALLTQGMRDLLHEPYRAHLYPGMAEVRAAARGLGAIATCVSGAGPTLLAIPAGGVEPATLARALAEVWQKQGIRAEGRAADFATTGAELTLCTW